MKIDFSFNGIHAGFEVTESGAVSLRNCGTALREWNGDGKFYPAVEVQGAGYNHNNHHGCKHSLTSPASELRYESHSFSRNEQGDLFTLVQKTDTLRVTTRWQFYDGIRVLRAETEVENIGTASFPLQYVSSFALTGLGHAADRRADDSYRIRLPHNTWYGECQWKKYRLHELGYDPVNTFSVKRISAANTGTWACSEHLPMGCFEQVGEALTWQIETSASWCWEISDLGEELYLRLSGPSWEENHFLKRLAPGESFLSVPCAVAFAGDFEDSIRELTKYRRIIRRPNPDNAHPSVIFNDYMNCLEGDPTTEKELPLIDAAAEAGCRYYCIDAGWYDDGPWWDGVGEWLPAKGRFPGGLKEVLDYIRKKGMIPGLWLELEVMGIHCPLADRLPDDWFFMLEGRRVIDESRYQLDFRNPEVRAHADRIIDRLVTEYGAGYIKMDYNINAGTGSDLHSDSTGEALLAHTRAYLEWLDGVFRRYPDLVIENCSSGGMRMEYSHLSRYSIQSVTDQTDYVKMAAIACNCMTACTPEQAAIWSYPLPEGDEEETVFNMVNAMLLRIHQSGHLAEISEARRKLVKEGLDVHRSITEELKTGLPFWPLGLGSFQSEFLCAGVDCGENAYLAVWHTTDGAETVDIPLRGRRFEEQLYPAAGFETDVRAKEDVLTVSLEGKKARLFKLKCPGRDANPQPKR